MFNKIAFVSYSISDMKRSVDFYQSTLGFQLLFQVDEWAEFMIGDQRFAIRQTCEAIQQNAAMLHLETDNIEDAIARLQAQGVAIHQTVKSHDYGKLAAFLDPDGNLIGLYEAPRPTGSQSK
ncbi:MAG: VOC family protein [Candidatus Nitrohelix vancouverensis]|uniref:VOC family protein n=1 Tax=Candidatus Nitrohelix vancouverensis TaxID=2705534 RepID=A0A7T0C3F7_9BACT|nr:MAG: VOC family protein [Candidatus Nitrohelix vancouverensis]